jgi:hypothetical protein
MVVVMGMTFVISGGLAAEPMGRLLAAEVEAGESGEAREAGEDTARATEVAVAA